MHSRTKAHVSEEQLVTMLEVAGLTEYTKVVELTGGEFNLAFKIFTEQGNYIMKVGPNPFTDMLTYERNIMAVELWAYEEVRKQTTITIPEIIYQGHDVIGNHWFVMTEMAGKLLCDSELTDTQLYQWYYQFGQALAQLHNIKGEGFGYQQVRLHPSWKEAYYDMVLTLLEDAEKQGNTWPDTGRILRFIRKWEKALEEVSEPRLIHFDLFNNNVFADPEGNFAGFIDTERCFFGDYYADFFAIDFLGRLEDNHGLIEGYNSVAQEKITFTPYDRARVALSRLMLGLLMFSEGTTRLATCDPEHWDRKLLATQIIEFAMKEMAEVEVPKILK